MIAEVLHLATHIIRWRGRTHAVRTPYSKSQPNRVAHNPSGLLDLHLAGVVAGSQSAYIQRCIGVSDVPLSSWSTRTLSVMDVRYDNIKL